MARTGSACFLFGGVLVGLLTTLAPSSFNNTTVQYGNAIVAGLVSLLTLLWDRRLRLWQFHAIVLVATLQITVSVSEAANPAVAVSFGTLYVFIACAAFFVAWPAAVVQLTVAVVCCTAVFVRTSIVPWWTGLIAAGTTAAIGVVITILGRIVSDAELDDVTGLPNRRGFDRLLGVATGRVPSGGHRFSVVFMCVDDYVAIDGEFGGQAGDQVVQQIVASWRGMLEPEQVLARRGADEFAVLIPGSTERVAVSIADRMRAAISMRCSAGVTTWEPGESSTETLARADAALRRAKRGGLDRTMVEHADLPPLAVDLRDALAAGAVNVSYQPIVGLNGLDVVGAEALVRWTPPRSHDVSVAELIRVAEESDLIAALGHYVLRRACLDAGWMQRSSAGPPFILSVNVSGLELMQEGYARGVFDALRDAGWPPQQLVVEITETVLDVDSPASIGALQDLREGGVRIAIDDFGTGYSSLSRLLDLPVDLLKLDASFITAVTSTSPEVSPLLQAVAALATALHLPVVAEGVETVQQVSVLQGLGLTWVQGFYFGRPQTAADLLETMTPRAANAR